MVDGRPGEKISLILARVFVSRRGPTGTRTARRRSAGAPRRKPPAAPLHLIRVNDPQRHAGVTDRVPPTPTRSTPASEGLRALSIAAVVRSCRDIKGSQS